MFSPRAAASVHFRDAYQMENALLFDLRKPLQLFSDSWGKIEKRIAQISLDMENHEAIS